MTFCADVGCSGIGPRCTTPLEFARSGDALIVWKLDPLARSMKQLIETVETLRLRGIGFRSLTEALDTTTAQGRLVFHAPAEFERSLIRERTQAGLAAARRSGRTGGRPPKLTEEDLEAERALLANPDMGVIQIAPPATLYRYIPPPNELQTPLVHLDRISAPCDIRAKPDSGGDLWENSIMDGWSRKQYAALETRLAEAADILEELWQEESKVFANWPVDFQRGEIGAAPRRCWSLTPTQ